MFGNFLVAPQLAASQEGLSSVELSTKKFKEHYKCRSKRKSCHLVQNSIHRIKTLWIIVSKFELE
jgi:hypothetical protein